MYFGQKGGWLDDLASMCSGPLVAAGRLLLCFYDIPDHGIGLRHVERRKGSCVKIRNTLAGQST